MNEYAVTLELRWWGLVLPRKTVDTFVVAANSAAHAEKLARGGFISGLEGYDQSFDDEEGIDLSHLAIRVLSINTL